MSGAPAFERLLRRDRRITLAGLAVLCLLAWLYLATGAGLGMSAREMAGFALFPHRQAAALAPAMPGMSMAAAAPLAWGPATWALVVAMWWIMMIAMMAPGAAPAILLFARVHRHAAAQGRIDAAGSAPTGAFTAGYLLVWLGFSLAAAALHRLLDAQGVVAMTGSQSRWLSGAVLLGAGLYQLSPLKHACLAHCRAPAAFLARHWRPRAAGALRLGALHGAFCVGCCWLLMALLFVGGVMNLVWIAALALLVLAEKLLPRGQWVGRFTGVALIAWGVATFLV